MATPVATLLGRAATLLQDPTNKRWTQTELLDWLNEAHTATVQLKPNAYVRLVTHQLVAGTLQTMPLDNVQLLDVLYNVDADDAPGRTIRVCTRNILDTMMPNWHAGRTSSTVVHYIYTPLDPNRFFVYPRQPADAPGRVALQYGAIPPACTAGGNIQLGDKYAPCLLDYMLYRAWSKDAEYADGTLAAKYFAQFSNYLTGAIESEKVANPGAGA